MAKSKKPRRKYNPNKTYIREGDLISRVAAANSNELFDENAAGQVVSDLNIHLTKVLSGEDIVENLYFIYRRTLLCRFVGMRTVKDIQYSGEETLEMIHKLTIMTHIDFINSVEGQLGELFFRFPESGNLNGKEEWLEETVLKIVEIANYIFFRTTLGAVTRAALDVENFMESKIFREYKRDAQCLYQLFRLSHSFCEVCRYAYTAAAIELTAGVWKDKGKNVA